jgi:hypothetical protein
VFSEHYEQQFVIWKKFREDLETSATPFEDTIALWAMAPLVNKHLDPFNSSAWPGPWQIIKEGKYNDLTKNIMIGHTLKLTKRFNDEQIEVRVYLDCINKVVYNTCCIQNKILNYQYGEVANEQDLPKELILQVAIPLPKL